MLTMGQAINEALREEMRRDEKVYIIGENVGTEGGVFRATSGLIEEFGEARVKNSPLSETVIAGSSVGAAFFGYRPVAEIMMGDFMFVAMDEIVSKMGKWHYMHAGIKGMKLPIVVRTTIGGYSGSAAEHSQSPVSYFLHAPGLKIVVPSTPYDGKGLLKTAIRDNNPVVFFEHRLLYRPTARTFVPEEEYLIPFGVADIKRAGEDVTVVATGFQVHLVLQAAEALANEGISVEVVDPRTLEPLDIETILQSVRKTGRAVVVDEDHSRCGVAAEIATQIMEGAFDYLDAPVKRVATENVPIPYALPMERRVLPSPERIIAAIKSVVQK